MYGNCETGKRYLIDIHPENFKIPDGFSFCRENDSLIVSSEFEAVKITVTEKGIEYISNYKHIFYERENIRQIFYTWDSMTCESCLYLVLYTSGSKPAVLLSGILSVLFPRYIEQEAEKILGMDDEIVIGEFNAGLKQSGYDNIQVKDISYKIDSDSAVFKTHTPIFILLAMHLISVALIFFAYFIICEAGSSSFSIILLIVMLLLMMFLDESKRFSIKGKQFEIVDSNMLINNRLLKSGSISDIDYVYMFDNAFPRDSRRRGCGYIFDLRIKCKDSADDYVLFRMLDRNTAEFLQKLINKNFGFNENFNEKVDLNKY